MRETETMLATQVRRLAREGGIDVVRFTHADRFEGYLLPNSPRRDPQLKLPEVSSLVVFGVYIGGFSLPEWDNPALGRTSRLFLSGFFSDVVQPLEPIASLLHEQGFSAHVCDGFQSGGSILPLKLAAVRAGIGWQGKHTLVISQDYGTFLALGGIVTDAPLPHDKGIEKDRCGKCRACQDACPTGALDEPYQLRRERCLSSLYQQDTLSENIYELMGNRIIDCEICQSVCPWNKKQLERPLATMRTRSFNERIDSLTSDFYLLNLARLSEHDYEEFIAPYRAEIPYRIFRRNVMAALGCSKQPEALPLLQAAVEDSYPEVREIARTSIGLLQDSQKR